MSEESPSLLKPFIDTDKAKSDISIDLTDLDNSMITHPAMELHYSLQTANARRQYERLKNAVEILEAKIDAQVRENLASEDSKKKPTEAAIKAAILTDPRYSAGQSKLIEAQFFLKCCEATENAFRGRKDILLEVARDRRKEREGEMRVMSLNAAKEAVMERISGR
jgi:hypothetical protein